jgi:hypothetical protein
MRPPIAAIALLALVACSTPGPTRTVMAPKSEPAPGSEEALAAADEKKPQVAEVRDTRLLAILGTTGESDGVMDVLKSDPAADQKLADAFKGNSFGVATGTKGATGHGVGTLGSGGGGYGARRVRGLVQLGATATTDMDDAAVRAILQRRSNQFRYCYEKALARNPKAGGVIDVELTVATTGRAKVTKADVKGPVDSVMLECVRRQLSRVRFPKPTGKAPGTVKQALAFSLK